MDDPRTDLIARHAASLVTRGGCEPAGASLTIPQEAMGLRQAIEVAARSLRAFGAPMPSVGLVRRHVRAMSMQALGADGYHRQVMAVWEAAEELMGTLEHGLGDVRTELVGRAARGQIDGGVLIHVRAITRTPIEEIAEVLVDFGYAEPAFGTAKTRHGRMGQLRFSDEGNDFVVTRVVRSFREADDRSLFRDARETVLRLDQVRAKVERARRAMAG